MVPYFKQCTLTVENAVGIEQKNSIHFNATKLVVAVVATDNETFSVISALLTKVLHVLNNLLLLKFSVS